MPRHVLVDDSDSDEPIALDSPPVAWRRTRSASSQPLPGRAGPSRSSKRRAKKQKTPDEDDEVVFVREEKVRQLTSRFVFAGARPLRKTTSTTSSASVPTASLGSTSSASTAIATPFLSSTPRQPLPVPEWLPKTAILKELPKCVLCQRDFKKAESGAARWRHLSTCVPPAFRPPNLPPDLEVLISTALEGPVEELTLLRRRTNAAAAADDLLSSFPDLVPKPKRVLRNTTVRASYSREGWSEEVDLRVVDVVGVSPMRQSRYLSRSVTPDPDATQLSPAHSLSSSPLLSTQPLGESSLSTEYSRPPRTRSAMSNLLPQAPPLIGLSQAMRYSFAEEEATQTQRAHIALSQYTSEVGLEAGDGFHFSHPRPVVDSKEEGAQSPFAMGSARNPQGAGPVTPRGDSTRSAAGDSQRLSGLASKRHDSGGARPSPPGSDSDNGDGMCTPSSTLGRLAISSPGRSPGSPTRRAQQEVIDLCSSSPSPPRAYSPLDWEYGDGAVLEFNPGPDWEYHSPDDHEVDAESVAPSVSRSDAGLKLSDIEWGGDAVLVWDGEYDDGDEIRFVEQGQGSEYEDEGDEDDEDEGEDEELGEDDYEVHDIDGSDDEAPTGSSNRMPDYNSWDIPKLQHLVKGYGYRPSKDRKVLVNLAMECWAALHPAPKSPTKNKGKAKAKVSTKSQTKPKPKFKSKAANEDVGPDPALDTLFYNLLTSDDALYARILRYEPLPFDELVSHAIAAGINSRGWRPRLKKFLDLKGVTYFTADPTAPRRRY